MYLLMEDISYLYDMIYDKQITKKGCPLIMVDEWDLVWAKTENKMKIIRP